MKILLIADHHPDALLDAQCVIQRLRRKYRECRISLMAEARLHSLARRLVDLDDLLTLPDADAPVKVFWIAGRQLEAWQKKFTEFDQALVLTRRWKPALVPWMAGVARRSGRLGRLRFMLINDARWMSSSQFPDRKSRYLALADDHGEMPDEPIQAQIFADGDNGQALIKSHYLNAERPAVVFCPGGKMPDRQRWPVERWSALAAQLIEQGWQVWLIAPVKEQAFCEQICAGLNREQQMEIANLSGRLAWDDKIDLIGLSRAVLAQETLYSQLSQALNHPLVMLQGAGCLQAYTPVDVEHQGQQLSLQRQNMSLQRQEQDAAVKRKPKPPARSAEHSERVAARVVSSDRHCQPCQHEVCQHQNGDRARGQTDPCIHELSVERVRSALLSMVPMQAVD